MLAVSGNREGTWYLLYWFRTDLVGLVLGNSTQRRVNHPACARVLAMHWGVGGVLGPFTCGFRAGVDAGERMGAPGLAWLRRVRCHEWPGGSGGVAQVRPAGAGVAVAVGKAAGTAAAQAWRWRVWYSSSARHTALRRGEGGRRPTQRATPTPRTPRASPAPPLATLRHGAARRRPVAHPKGRPNPQDPKGGAALQRYYSLVTKLVTNIHATNALLAYDSP